MREKTAQSYGITIGNWLLVATTGMYDVSRVSSSDTDFNCLWLVGTSAARGVVAFIAEP